MDALKRHGGMTTASWHKNKNKRSKRVGDRRAAHLWPLPHPRGPTIPTDGGYSGGTLRGVASLRALYRQLYSRRKQRPLLSLFGRDADTQARQRSGLPTSCEPRFTMFPEARQFKHHPRSARAAVGVISLHEIVFVPGRGAGARETRES